MSVHQSVFPSAEELEGVIDERRAKNWDLLLKIREDVLKALEPVRVAKTISSGLEAKVNLTTSGELAALFQEYSQFLPGLFIVSQVVIAEGSAGASNSGAGVEGLSVEIRRADGKKCERCWNYSVHVGESAEYPTVCERCLAALSEMESTITAGGAKS